ncbi:leucine--tRNA ligase [Spirochaetota bacterium]
MAYDFKRIEKKWQKYWDERRIYKVTEDSTFPKEKRFYCLDMFPYPSGDGLHVGHPEGYTASDIVSRYMRMRGYNVLHPMGFDSFGLPAENYAIKTGTHPKESTDTNIANFRRQIKSLGFAYDWGREVSTCNPEYFKWTQWIFLKMFEKGLAYEDNMPINWCSSCETGLANEEVKEGKCERCGEVVIRKNMRQWMLRITAYADRLLEDLDELDWPESIKLLQKNWIGKSHGADVDFKEKKTGEVITVFTTRPDTLFGATYMVLAPEHELVDRIASNEQKNAVQEYREKASKKSDLERTELTTEKTGVFTGAYAINPVNNNEIPIWISDYVLLSYGTGAIMAVPAHDQRDFEFAQKFSLAIIQVVSTDGKERDHLEESYEGDGVAINSGEYNGQKTDEFKKNITHMFEEKKQGKGAVNYKLRDWVFSRQRFWGEPIPVVHCEKCGIVAIDENELPLLLPEVTSYKPTGTGESPLAEVDDWVNTSCPKCKGKAKRETNTMPQWAGSCWYYLRYLDAQNDKAFVSKEALGYWNAVDLYIGGAEHAVLHLLYARFWHKFLYDIKAVPTKEPFLKYRFQGMILGENGEKMSKSRGNVINPDDIIVIYGADAMRLYEMFMGPLEVTKPWNTNGLKGVYKFLDRVYKVFTESEISDEEADEETKKLLHKTIKKVTNDIEDISSFNTAISQMMIFVNHIQGKDMQSKKCLDILARLLAPFAPHLAEELWECIGNEPSIISAAWPGYDESLTIDETVEIVLQVNGKIRSKINLSRDISKDAMIKAALEDERIQDWTNGKKVIKEIAVPNKLVNIVVEQ